VRLSAHGLEINSVDTQLNNKAEMNLLSLDILYSAFEEGEKPWT
tara:strand:+ start:13 stop:144 length:132 start_codon:yes stop_codon:yes gene_type:complete